MTRKIRRRLPDPLYDWRDLRRDVIRVRVRRARLETLARLNAIVWASAAVLAVIWALSR